MNRRSFLSGLLFAPAIIRTPGPLMPVKRLWQPKRFPPVEIAPGIWITPHWEWNGSEPFDSDAAYAQLVAASRSSEKQEWRLG